MMGLADVNATVCQSLHFMMLCTAHRELVDSLLATVMVSAVNIARQLFISGGTGPSSAAFHSLHALGCLPGAQACL
jgi:hypothetical protein